MSNQEILEKAIQKAIENGWSDGKQYASYLQEGFFGKGEYDFAEVIYRHDFAKALWGGCTFCTPERKTRDHPDHWQYHLQQMVIADDPIKYLGDNI